MYLREWKCRVPYRHRDGFMEYLRETGVTDTAAVAGCLGHQILERYLKNAVELTLLTWWDTLDSVKAYAGSNITKARLYPEDARFELDPDEHVTHYEVAESSLEGLA